MKASEMRSQDIKALRDLRKDIAKQRCEILLSLSSDTPVKSSRLMQLKKDIARLNLVIAEKVKENA